MMYISKFINLINHPRTFRLLMDSKLQEEVAIWYQISSLCGPHSLLVSLCSISTLIFPCIYLFISFIKYLYHSNPVLKYFIPDTTVYALYINTNHVNPCMILVCQWFHVIFQTINFLIEALK